MSPGGFDTSFTFGKPGSQRSRDDRPEPVAPLIIGVLGDFAGDAPRAHFANRSAPTVDVDTFAAALSAFSPSITLDGIGEVTFATLDDFEPASLARRIPALATITRLRARAADAATFADALRESAAIGIATSSSPVAAPAATPAAPDAPSPLAALLGGALRPPSDAPPQGISGLVESLVKQAMAGGSGANSGGGAGSQSPEQAALIAALDLRLAAAIRTVLHHSGFQAIESAWRSVHTLTSRVASGKTIRLRLFDVSASELLSGGPQLIQAAARALTVHTGESSGGGRLGYLLGLFTLRRTAEDAVLGAMLAGIAHATGTFALAGASSEHVGCPSFGRAPDAAHWVGPTAGTDDADAWSDLAKAPIASRLGFAAPRLLLRLPYGRAGEPCEGVLAHFEEFEPATSTMGGQPVHEQYLWGCGALGPALVLADRFLEDSWDLSTFEGGDVESLPMHSFKLAGAGSAAMQACAEAWLNERALQRLTEAGLIPVLSVKGRDAARVGFIRAMNGQQFTLPGEPQA